MRPVTKFVFPLLLQFQFNVAGVQPKSLQSMNSLGQVMFLNSSNQLSQYDMATARALKSVNLGTRPPLKQSYPASTLVQSSRFLQVAKTRHSWILTSAHSLKGMLGSFSQ